MCAVTQNGDSLFHVAARTNRMDILERLFERWSDWNGEDDALWITLNSLNNDGETVLMTAMKKKHFEFIMSLWDGVVSNGKELDEMIRCADEVCHLLCVVVGLKKKKKSS